MEDGMTNNGDTKASTTRQDKTDNDGDDDDDKAADDDDDDGVCFGGIQPTRATDTIAITRAALLVNHLAQDVVNPAGEAIDTLMYTPGNLGSVQP